MDISNIANTAIQFKIGEKNYLVSKLNLQELFCTFQKRVKEMYIEDLKTVAQTLEGKEKLDFLNAQMKQMPKGSELESLAGEYMDTLQGGVKILEIILNKHQNVTEDELKEIVGNSDNASDITAITSYAFDNVKIEESSAEKNVTKQKKQKKASPNQI